MTILAFDAFIRANQSGWGTASDGESWANTRGTATVSITSNEGTLRTASSSFTVMQIGTKIAANQEILVRMKPASAVSSNQGIVARFTNSNNFYYGVLFNNTAVIGKDVSNVFTTLTNPAFTFSTSNFYWLRFNLIGTTLRLRVWQDGTAEPTTWTATTTDSALASGGFGLANDHATVDAQFDHLTVTNASTGSFDGYGGSI